MGPKALAGNLKVLPRTVLKAGYGFKGLRAPPAATVQLSNARVAFEATCTGGGGGGAVVAPLSGHPISVLAKSKPWYPTADRRSSLAYQDSVTIPNLYPRKGDQRCYGIDQMTGSGVGKGALRVGSGVRASWPWTSLPQHCMEESARVAQ